jgi:hypothetical protein
MIMGYTLEPEAYPTSGVARAGRGVWHGEAPAYFQ